MAPPLRDMWRVADRELLAACCHVAEREVLAVFGGLLAVWGGHAGLGDESYWRRGRILLQIYFAIGDFVKMSGERHFQWRLYDSISKLPACWLLGWLLTRWLLRLRDGSAGHLTSRLLPERHRAEA